MNKSECVNELAASLSALQGELVDTYKGAQGHGYKYATLSDILTAVRPLLKKHNLAVSQLVGGDNGSLSVETILMSSSGQYISAAMHMPIDTSNKRINVYQSLGSGVSYLRRYAIASILGISSTDDDAHAAAPSIGDNEESLKELRLFVATSSIESTASQEIISKALNHYGVASIDELSLNQLQSIIAMNYTVKQMRDLIVEISNSYARIAQTAEALDAGKVPDDIKCEIEEVLSYAADMIENDQECYPSEIIGIVEDIEDLYEKTNGKFEDQSRFDLSDGKHEDS